MTETANVIIDGKKIALNNRAGMYRVYREAFGSDFALDLQRAAGTATPGRKMEMNSDLMAVVEKVFFAMAKTADPENTPDTLDDFLGQFNLYSYLKALPTVMNAIIPAVEDKKQTVDRVNRGHARRNAHRRS